MRRYLLYNSYKFLKKIGYIHWINTFNNYANIIFYHRVNNYDSNALTTPTAVFEEMMHAVSRNYNVVSLKALIEKIKNKKPIEPKTVVITFDDGYRDNLLCAAPILQKYNIPATFFITSGYINTNRVLPWDEQNGANHPLMSWDEVKELVRMGFDIGSHTVNHVNLGKVSMDIARREIIGSKEQIEDKINKRITAISYPFGRRKCFRSARKEIIKEAGFDSCCSGYGGKVTECSDLYNLYRISMYPNTIELLMELDNFMTHFDGKMNINLYSSHLTSLKIVKNNGRP